MEKVKKIFRSRPKLMIGLVVVLALSLPFVINQVLKSQDIRQRASTAPAIQVYLSPEIVNTYVGRTSNARIFLTTSTNDVGSLKTKISYDPTMVELSNFAYPSKLQPFSEDKHTSGIFGLTLLNPSSEVITGSEIEIMAFQVKALKTGRTTIKISHESTSATATGQDSFLTIDNLPAMTATYTMKDEDCTALATGRPDACYCTTNSQCASNDCRSSVNGPTPLPGLNQSENICWPTTPYGDSQENLNASITPMATAAASPTPLFTATPYPTSTLYPTPTNNPGETYIKFSFQLPGIGVGSANLGLNSTPLDSQRTVWITVLDEANNPIVTDKQGIAVYSSTSGKYEGNIGLGSSFAPTPTPTPSFSDKFVVKIKVNNSLYKRIPGIVTIYYGSQENSSAEVALVSGDLNNDNTLGVIDWTFMIACVKNEASCTENIRKLADLNNNGSVDEIDVQILQRGFALREGD